MAKIVVNKLADGFVEIVKKFFLMEEEVECAWMAGHQEEYSIYGPEGLLVSYDTLENKEYRKEYNQKREEIVKRSKMDFVLDLQLFASQELTVEVVKALGHIPEKIAQAIVDSKARTEEDLLKIKGVGQKTAEKVLNLLDTLSVEEENIHKGGDHMITKKDLKGKEGSFFARNLVIVPNRGNVAKFRVIPSVASIEISDLTRPYVQENIVFPVLPGLSATPFKKASLDALQIVISSRRQKELNARLITATYAIVDHGGKNFDVYLRWNDLDADQDLEAVMDKARKWIHLTGKEIEFNYKGTILRKYPEVVTLPKGARIFDAFQRTSTTSQQRQLRLLSFAKDVLDYEKLLDEVTVGESSMRLKKQEISVLNAADLSTRISSHFTAAGGNDIVVKTIAILKSKLESVDGNVIINETLLPDWVGKSVQGRNHSAKFNGDIVLENAFMAFLSMYHWYVIYRNRITKAEVDQLNWMLNKSERDLENAFPGYDGVMILDHEGDVPQMIGNLDTFKDVWDYKRYDYLRSLNVTEYDGEFAKPQHTSFQMLKCLEYSALINGPKAVAEYNEVMKEIIDEHFAELFSEDEAKRLVGWNEDFSSMPIGVLAGKLHVDLSNYHALMYSKLQDLLKRCGKDVHRVAFNVKGIYPMASADFACWIGKQVLYANGSTKTIDAYMAGEEGDALAMKYPSVENTGYGILHFISKEELMARIDSLEITDAERTFVMESYETLQPGNLIMSGNPVVAKIFAGYDKDGDELALIQDKRIVDFAKKYIASLAIDIHTPKDQIDQNIKADTSVMAHYLGIMASWPNKSVGETTNYARLFTETLLLILSGKISKRRLVVIRRAARKAFGNENPWGVEVEGGKYVSPIQMTELSGFPMATIDLDTVNKITAQFATMSLTEDNARAILPDMSIVARYWQELTIDASKKGYVVDLAYVDEMETARITMSNVVNGCEFRIVEDGKRHIKDIQIADTALLKDAAKHNGYWSMGDSFTDIRRYAASVVLKYAKELAAKYNMAHEEAQTRRMVMQEKYVEDHDDLFAALNLGGRLGRSLLDAYAQTDKAMKKQYGDILKNSPSSIRNTLNGAIADSIKYESSSFNDAATNMLRRLGMGHDWKACMDRMYAVATGETISSRFCREEMVKYFLDKENIRHARRVRLYNSDDVYMFDNAMVEVYSGIVSTSIGELGAVGRDIEDGIYNAEVIDGIPYITEKASDRIEIPEVDNKELIVLVEGDDMIKKLFAHLKVSKEMVIRSKKNRTLYFADGNNKQISLIATNSFTSAVGDKKSVPIMTSNAVYDLLVDKHVVLKAGKYVRATLNERGFVCKQTQCILVLEEKDIR